MGFLAIKVASVDLISFTLITVDEVSLVLSRDFPLFSEIEAMSRSSRGGIVLLLFSRSRTDFSLASCQHLVRARGGTSHVSNLARSFSQEPFYCSCPGLELVCRETPAVRQ